MFIILAICLSVSAVFAQEGSSVEDKETSKNLVKVEFKKEVSNVFVKKEFSKEEDFSKKIIVKKEKFEKDSKTKKKKDDRKGYEVIVTHSTESLTRNLGIWRTTDFHVQKKFSDKKIIWGGYRNSQRKNVFDQQVIAGFYKPFNRKWGVTAEGQYSPTNNFVGKVNLLGKVEHVFKKGWVGHFGARFRSYDTVKVVTQFTTAERYWGNNLAGYTLNITKLSTGGTALSHRTHYSRYYGESVNSIGFAVSAGKEVENLAGNLGVLRSNVLSANVSLRHWVTNNFGILVDATIHRQGNLYYRRGLNFGVRYRF